MEEVIKKVENLAFEETRKYGTPLEVHINLSNTIGQRIALNLGVNKDIVMLGTLLMDVKLGECIKDNKIEEHAKISADIARDFLKKENLDEEIISKVVNCVEAHHKTIPYICKEAEVCANADCYRFLHPTGFLAAFMLFGSRTQDYKVVLDNVEKKLDEKWGIISIPQCKEELEPFYKQFKNFIKEARNLK